MLKPCTGKEHRVKTNWASLSQKLASWQHKRAGIQATHMGQITQREQRRVIASECWLVRPNENQISETSKNVEKKQMDSDSDQEKKWMVMPTTY